MPKRVVVNPGDIYRKVSAPHSVWRVDRILEYGDIPPHVRLVEHGGNFRTMTVARSALLDYREYKLLESAPPEELPAQQS
ncbi:MAG: hypothetical protein ACPGOY_16550 [Rhodospirillaceae bacterium]